MPAASFGQDGTAEDPDTDARADLRFAAGEALLGAGAAPGRLGALRGGRRLRPRLHRHDPLRRARRVPLGCPDPAIVFERSSDGGRTWSKPRFLCPCPGVEGQADPVLVTDERGRLFATWMNDFVVHFSRSDDFGRTWTEPRPVDGRLRWSDKPWIGVSDDGKDVYITFNGPGRSEGTPYTVYSHNAGTRWSQPVGGVRTNGLYWFAGGLTVTPEGTAISSQDAYEQDYRGRRAPVRAAFGRWWTLVEPGTHRGVQAGTPLSRWAGCGLGFLGTTDGDRLRRRWSRLRPVESADRAGRTRARLPAVERQQGRDVVAPRKVSAAKESRVDSEFPMIVAADPATSGSRGWTTITGAGTRGTVISDDGGHTWLTPVRLSTRQTALPYKSPRGFRFPYGDYGQLAIDGHGRTHAVWGGASTTSVRGASGTPAAHYRSDRSPSELISGQHSALRTRAAEMLTAEMLKCSKRRPPLPRRPPGPGRRCRR